MARRATNLIGKPRPAARLPASGVSMTCSISLVRETELFSEEVLESRERGTILPLSPAYWGSKEARETVTRTCCLGASYVRVHDGWGEEGDLGPPKARWPRAGRTEPSSPSRRARLRMLPCPRPQLERDS